MVLPHDELPSHLRGHSPAELIESVGTWYHRLELDGGTTPGLYDMAPTVSHYQLPDLNGLRVLDVGVSNGFFSFLFESMGACRVVGVELPTFAAHDYPRWYRDQEVGRRTEAELAEIDWNELHGGFVVARHLRGSAVERLLSRIYDLPEASDERFDFAFCSNVFIHLKSPVEALEAIREMLVPGGRAVFATPVIDLGKDISGARFNGDPKLCSWWMPTREAFLRMCQAAGFEDAHYVGVFDCNHTNDSHGGIEDAVGVVHCRRGDA